ncbi:hypothetical protein [Luteipulveratus mongoliensis]|uniref:Uncharacterized protein n=1 Tax=Luteipulveratus mongoliensis TaxID=571913 RepID=A0A0K1JE98_9MICO|nr:hypothetical protein [Luteipulveratus mongoliensis]AKU14918.1 hypothetical protein VV02_01965 [Luteipulveratus mongoliensis]
MAHLEHGSDDDQAELDREQARSTAMSALDRAEASLVFLTQPNDQATDLLRALVETVAPVLRDERPKS